jgi:DNA-binding IscR family transcriptional regulator
MAGSPYATLADVLRADLTNQEHAFFDHASRHRCRDSECETKRMLRTTRESIRERLARETASPSPAPQRSAVTTFIPLPPHLR